MKLDQLDLKNGKWVVANCGKHPSEKNCKLVIMAPENQRQDLLDAIVDHAVNQHGHDDSDELRKMVDKEIDVITI